MRSYKTDRPLNSAVISPLKEHIILGGGQDAMSVTTTAGKQGHFEASLWHMIYEEEFGRIKGHFGPINSLAINPDGRSYCRCGEGRCVRAPRLRVASRRPPRRREPRSPADSRDGG